MKTDLEKAGESEKKLNQSVYETMNKELMSQLKFALGTNKTFFVLISAMNLVDESGIIDLLTKSGCKVKRII